MSGAADGVEYHNRAVLLVGSNPAPAPSSAKFNPLRLPRIQTGVFVICALTGLLSFLGHTEPRPKGFPRSESWVEIPKKLFVWP